MDSTFPASQFLARTTEVYPPPNFAAKSETTLHSAVLRSTDDIPPPLCYDIASKKRSIAIQWTITVSCNAFIPLILYFGLRYGTSLSKEIIINITQITNISSLLSWPYRLWQLLRRNGERAPRDRTALTWDSFQWSFLSGIPIVTAFCVVASIQTSLRILSMGPVVMFGITALQCVLSCWMSNVGMRIPCRISSMPAGSVIRPAVYSIMEDLTAVDGAGGQEYRNRLNHRYEASAPFRQLVYNVTLYLGVGFLVQTAAQVAVLVAASDEVCFAVSTALLWLWAGFSAWWGVYYANRSLTNERLWWKQRVLEKGIGGL